MVDVVVSDSVAKMHKNVVIDDVVRRNCVIRRGTLTEVIAAAAEDLTFRCYFNSAQDVGGFVADMALLGFKVIVSPKKE